jgi:hypothetical protein
VLHDRPDLAELLDAVGEFLDEEVLPATGGVLRFHTRVARNVLRIVARQLQLSGQQEAEHQARLARLGCADDDELALGIRAGRFDDRAGEVFAVVQESVRAKLAVANPGYLDGPAKRS